MIYTMWCQIIGTLNQTKRRFLYICITLYTNIKHEGFDDQ